MSGSVAAAIVIPIAAVAVIAVWLTLVWRAARRRPAPHGPGQEPSRPVAGGIFRGDRRQLMPSRYTTPPGAAGESEPAGSDATPRQSG